MNLRVVFLFLVAAIAPASGWAAITVNTESVNGVALFSLTGSDVSTADTLGGTSGLFQGIAQALDWNMRVIIQSANDADGVAVYRFTVFQDAEIRLTSTQNPFAGLDNLTLMVRVGSGVPVSTQYVDGVFAEIDAVPVGAFETFTVTAQWTSSNGPFTEIDVDFVLVATNPPEPESLNVAVNGNGRVISQPAGIDCPGDCTEAYRRNTSVALSAAPGPGQQFAEWLGDCSGSGSCTVVMDQARTVSARFEPARAPDLQPSSTRIAFGEVPIGQSSPVQLLLIENAGDAPLMIGTLSLEGEMPTDYLFSPGDCSLQTLDAGQNCSVGVVFAPQATGFRTARLRIESNDPDGTVFVDLVGGDDVLFFSSFE
ncbi:MAG: choice-of-anchor D domain-containing protein [Wenzhouxiangella sp.]|jgi:hypothetical protein|nr:choice-of-anchor D domain-containing protein [Wenzhouxiangella sp.]